MHDFFFDLTILIVIASITAIVFRFLKQPPIVAYIATGIIAAQLFLIDGESGVSLHTLSDIGITLLLFILGIELKISSLRSIGKVALISGVAQILITLGLGFLLIKAIGFSNTDSFYLSLCLSLSSTIVIVKLLTDKKDLNSLYGKITIGILLVQDFFAILALIALTSLGAGSLDALAIGLIILKAVLLVAVIVLMSKYIFPALVHYLSRSQEILFLSSLAWALGFALFISSPLIGFSIEIGGFLAGLALANAVESSQIISRVRALRDFFIVIFFVVLGSNVKLDSIANIIPQAIILSVFVLLAKPVITSLILLVQKYTTRTSLFTGLSLGQVSEFSLILIILGQKISGVSGEVLSLVTLVAIICFVLSPYFVMNNQKIYKVLSPILKKLQHRRSIESKFHAEQEFQNHFVLIGGHRMGFKVLEALKEETDNILVVDFNPDVVRELNKKGYNAVFGDISDTDIQEKADIAKAKIVYSTVPDFEDNLILCRNVKKLNKNIKVILTAHTDQDKKDLLKSGADYVVMPYSVAAHSVARIINSENWHLLEK